MLHPSPVQGVPNNTDRDQPWLKQSWEPDKWYASVGQPDFSKAEAGDGSCAVPVDIHIYARALLPLSSKCSWLTGISSRRLAGLTQASSTLEVNRTGKRVKIHGVPVARYVGKAQR